MVVRERAGRPPDSAEQRAHARRDGSDRGLVLGHVVVLGDLAHVVRRGTGHEALEREAAKASLALLERGLVVTGIDPAEMDPRVLAEPRFTHLRARARDVKRSIFRECRWLVMDANVAPNYTLDTLDGLLTQAGVRPEGLLLTLKLTDPELADKLPAIAERIRRYGYRNVRMRQLAFNRREICAVVTDK